ncbi:hypothetical protein FRC11_002118, partial [Ceratobasidium sp. 423]
MGGNGQSRAKRARTDTTYAPCPCYKCQGDLQLPDTIRHHKQQYPWPLSSPPRASSPTSNNNALRDVTNRSSPQRHASAPIRSPSPAADFENNGTRARSRSPGAPGQTRRRASSPNLPGFNANDRRDYQFDDLGPNRWYASIGVNKDLLDEGEGASAGVSHG